MKKFLLSLIFSLLLASPAWGTTNRFVNVNGGEWNTAANWLLDDDGTTARVPLATDDVVITTSLGASKTITITTTNANAKSIDFSTAGAAFTLSGSRSIYIRGSLTCKAGMTWNLTGALYVGFETSGTLTTNSVSLSSLTSLRADSTGSNLSIGDTLNLGTKPIIIYGGSTLTTNNNNITCGLLTDGSQTGTATLTLGSSTINCTKVSFGTCTLTVTANTAAINITSTADITANFGGQTWGGTTNVVMSTTKTMTLDGTNTFGNLTINNAGTGKVTFGAAQVVTGTTTLTQGTLDLNGNNLTTATFSSSNTNTRILQDTVTGAKIVLQGLTGTVFDMTDPTNLTVSNAPAIDMGTSSLTQTGDVTFAGGGKTFGNFKVTKHAGDFDCIISGANTFGVITMETPDITYQFSHLQLPAGVTTTCTSFVSDGTASYQNSLLSSSAAAHTLSDTGGTNTLTYTTIAYSQAEGGATWIALPSAGNVDGGNNTGWSFVVATPTFNNGTATYNNDVSVTISCTTSGATICYTTDGSDPTATTPGTCANGTTYTVPVSITATGTVLKAIGTKTSYDNSAVASATYTLTNAAVSASPAAGTYLPTNSVALSTGTTGGTIRYTTNGDTPACPSTGTLYSAPFTTSTTQTVKAIACKTNYNASAVLSAVYTIRNAAIFYVDSAITDTYVGSGTPDFTTYNPTTFATDTGSASVYKTVADVNAQLYVGGDSILFRGSQSWGVTTLTLANGADNMTIADYGTGDLPKLGNNTVRPINIDYSAITPKIGNLTIKNIDIGGGNWSEVKDYNLYLEEINGVTIDGVVGDGHYGGISETNEGKSAIICLHCTGSVEIKNCNLYNWGPATIPSDVVGQDLIGVVVYEQTSGSVSIHDNVIHDIEADGIQVYMNTVPTSIYNNTVYNCGENSLDQKGSDNVTVYNNTFYRTSAFRGSGGSSANATNALVVVHLGAENTIIRNNTFYGPLPWVLKDPTGISIGEVYGLDIAYNSFATIPINIYIGAGLNSNDVKIYYNIFTDPLTSTGGVYELNTTGTGTEILNNTFYLSSASTVRIPLTIDNSNGTIIKNNIIYNNTTSTYEMFTEPVGVNAPSVLSNNIFYLVPDGGRTTKVATINGTLYTSSQLAAFNAATGGANLFSNPLFVSASDFHLQPTSPAINAGVDVGLVLDYEGRMVPIGPLPDIGAYEYDLPATGTLVAALAALIGEDVGGVGTSGTLAATLAALIASLSGVETASSPLSGCAGRTLFGSGSFFSGGCQ